MCIVQIKNLRTEIFELTEPEITVGHRTFSNQKYGRFVRTIFLDFTLFCLNKSDQISLLLTLAVLAFFPANFRL